MTLLGLRSPKGRTTLERSIVGTLVGREPEVRTLHELVDGVADRGTPAGRSYHGRLLVRFQADRVNYSEFPGRPHFPGAPGWEEVADVALTWAVEHAGDRRPVVIAS